ncbi:VIT family protein, partial [Acinetobacter sp. SCC474]
HYSANSGWLRASILGANDGIISVTSLLLGVIAGGASNQTIVITCIAAIASGAFAMAAGEYISVKSQQDIERSDLKKEETELYYNPEKELKELQNIYISRGLDEKLAREVAIQLTEHNALEAHARDEIGINDQGAAQPLLAAFSSAVAFFLGGIIPLMSIIFSLKEHMEFSIIMSGIIALTILGGFSGYMSGLKIHKSIMRIVFWGGFSMFVTFSVGSIFK